MEMLSLIFQNFQSGIDLHQSVHTNDEGQNHGVDLYYPRTNNYSLKVSPKDNPKKANLSLAS
jgi:hypothetical protein